MANELTAEEYQVVLRHDFNSFVERSFYELHPATEFMGNWHIELVAAELEACRRGETKRLIINVPPRSLKSHCASVSFPAFLLGQDPSAQIICASYAQDLSNKLSLDCRSLMSSTFYQQIFGTRLSSQRNAVSEFTTTKKGFRLATSVGGVLTGRGAKFIIIDDPLKPDDALSETQRNSVNQWYDNTLYSRLNDKRDGCIIIIMQRLHEDDLVGHVQELEDWKVLRFPAIAEEDEQHLIPNLFGTYEVQRLAGEALHPEREPLDTLENLRRTQGEYNFAGQYQQSPAPLGGGLIKASWFQFYDPCEELGEFDIVLQSWDTANKDTELSDFSVCTTWGKKDDDLHLLHVFRERLQYPDLKRAVCEYADYFQVRNILIEDKASGTQLIQELIRDGVCGVTRYQPKLDKIMRLHSVSSTIENGFVHLPNEAEWLPLYLHELTTFPNGKHDDQADSTSQALEWVRTSYPCYGLVQYLQEEARRQYFGTEVESDERTCTIAETGQTFRLRNNQWVDVATGIPYVGP
jgi:predicted phage terminase large subunit-like protein